MTSTGTPHASLRFRTMTSAKRPQDNSLLCAVLEPERLAVVRVVGRGSFSNAMALKRFAQHVREKQENCRYALDLRRCDSMDSTFMGVLAGLSLDRLEGGKPRVIIVNANEHCQRLLRNLGLSQIIEIREEKLPTSGEESCEEISGDEATPPSKAEQILLTLQAHKDLVKVDEENEVRFQAVIEYLEKSLAEESRSGNGN